MSAWPMVRLGDLMRKTKSIDPRKFPEKSFNLFSIPAYDNGSPEKTLGKDVGSSKTLLQNNDVVLSKIVPHIRRAWVIPPGNENIGSSEWIVFNDERFIPHFLAEYLKSNIFHQQLLTTVAGIGGSLKRSRPAAVAELEAPLPPLAEQKRITEMLDVVAKMIDLTKSEISKMQALIGELLRQLVSNNVEKKSLGAITSSKPDYGISRSSAPYDPSIGRYVRITDINDFGDLQDKKVSPKQGENSLPTKKLLQSGDLIIARSGATVGKAYLHYRKEIPHWFAGYLIRFAIDSKIISPEIVFDYTKTNEYQAWIDGRKQAVAQPNISAKIYSQELQIPIPSQDDQEMYLQKRKEVYKVIKLLHRKLTLLRELQCSLSARAFAGLL